MSGRTQQPLEALRRAEVTRQQRDAVALQHAETRLVGLCNTLRDAQHHREGLRRALAALGAIPGAVQGAVLGEPLSIDRAWAWRARMQHHQDALREADQTLHRAQRAVDEATRVRDALRQAVTVATARSAACGARLEAHAATRWDPHED